MRQEEIHVGDLIFYKLRPSDSPINPKEEQRAFVKKKKYIIAAQITRIEKGTD